MGKFEGRIGLIPSSVFFLLSRLPDRCGAINKEIYPSLDESFWWSSSVLKTGKTKLVKQ